MPKKTDAALRERALRMVEEHRADYPPVTAVSKAVADRLGIGTETVPLGRAGRDQHGSAGGPDVGGTRGPTPSQEQQPDHGSDDSGLAERLR